MSLSLLKAASTLSVVSGTSVKGKSFRFSLSLVNWSDLLVMFCLATLKNCSLNLKKFSPGLPEKDGHFIFSDFLGNSVASPLYSSSVSSSLMRLSMQVVAS